MKCFQSPRLTISRYWSITYSLAQLCGGSLISRHLIASAYHCALKDKKAKPCDYSDGKAKAILNSKNLVIKHNLKDIINTGEQRQRVTLEYSILKRLFLKSSNSDTTAISFGARIKLNYSLVLVTLNIEQLSKLCFLQRLDMI